MAGQLTVSVGVMSVSQTFTGRLADSAGASTSVSVVSVRAA